ncbi:hypothetical protein GCM10010403_45440 [Glycomyces rutgersensis]|uniref:Uncharacterized protein n=1 Tax=Glycomyces rutgersensis TaxID=58115 RepID=A0ABP5T6S6_9ACTN
MAEDDGGHGGIMRPGEVEDAAKGAAGVLDVERFHGPNVTEGTWMRHGEKVSAARVRNRPRFR